LTELNVRHESEWSPFPDSKFVPGLLAIDAACKDQKIAIEFDGPNIPAASIIIFNTVNSTMMMVTKL
jgi:hypothetical protein